MKRRKILKISSQSTIALSLAPVILDNDPLGEGLILEKPLYFRL